MHWMLLPLRRYLAFSGRSRRKEFWLYVLFTILAGALASIIDSVMGYATITRFSSAADVGAFVDGSGGPVNSILKLALLVPSFTVSVRRLHDTEHSAWWVLMWLVPIIGWIVLLVFYCSDGTRGPNRFGADPKQENLADVFS